MFELTQETALNLVLEGTIGSFKIGAHNALQNSLEVKYLLTHVGLNFATASNDALLTNLAPVREIFDFTSLDFDEIMQRDIDDARVSSELIPYILDEKSADLIKLFPPIVVVVLPIVETRNLPANFYPAVVLENQPPTDGRKWEQHTVRSGSLGNEAFQFEQPIVNDRLIAHNQARLKLNTHRTKLVIVDGQHRAMALLALYRNLKDQWSDEKRAPFKDYYSEWTPNYISSFNLSDINLPVLLCTIPALDEAYQGDFDVKRAARSIFLTLNKNARKVSESRNKLLDDNDLIAVFMRRSLSVIKNRDDRSGFSLRMWNVELDQTGDKLKILSRIAITGVNHVYYMIEHMLLDSGDVSGVAPRSGKFYKRTNLDDCLDRLNGKTLLGEDVAALMRRDTFSSEVVKTLGPVFDRQFGHFLIRAFEAFIPYEIHNRAVLELGARIQKYQDRQLRPIIFEGQGLSRVFETHRINLSQKIKEGYFSTDVPAIEETLGRLNATASRIDEALEELLHHRAQNYFSGISDKKLINGDGDSVSLDLIEKLNALYDDVFSTVAFQSALVCGFLGEWERASNMHLKSNGSRIPDAQKEQSFEEYLAQLSGFFVPETPSRLKHLFRVFFGDSKTEDGKWIFIQNNQTFRHVVYRGEMQPDQWPKYKYLLLELWKPSNLTLLEAVLAERTKCRSEVVSALHKFYLTDFCRETQKLEDNLNHDEREQVIEKTMTAYNGLLRALGGDLITKTFLKRSISVVSAAAASDPEADQPGPEVSASDL